MSEIKTYSAFHCKTDKKKFYLARMKQHIKADTLRHHMWYRGGKGCAVGCTLHGREMDIKPYGQIMDLYEKKLGIPAVVGAIMERIFEGLDCPDAKYFSLDFLKAVKVGADLGNIYSYIAIYNLNQCKKILYKYKDYSDVDYDKITPLLTKAIKAHQNRLKGVLVNFGDYHGREVDVSSPICAGVMKVIQGLDFTCLSDPAQAFKDVAKEMEYITSYISAPHYMGNNPNRYYKKLRDKFLTLIKAA